MFRLRKGAILLIIVLVSISAPLISAGKAYAISDPDSISLEAVRVFEDVWETGDQLYFVEYKVMYDPTPSEDASDTFFVGIYSGTTLERSKPLMYYDHNILCLYLDPESALVSGGTYTVRIAGNPAYFTVLTEGVNQASWGLSSAHWLPGTYLCDYVVSTAEDLEISWGIDLLDSNNRLNDTGATTFELQIPTLQSTCTDIYTYSIVYPTPYPTSSNGSTYQPTLTSYIPTRLQSAFNGIGNWIGIPGVYVGGILAAGLYLLLVGRLYLATGSQVGSIVIGMPFFLLMFLIGVIPLVVFFVFGTIVIVLAGIVFILGRFA